LLVVDQAGNPTSSIIMGSAFGTHFLNTVNNVTGQINYADGPAHRAIHQSSTFILATIRFKALTAVDVTSVTFSFVAPRARPNYPSLGRISWAARGTDQYDIKSRDSGWYYRH